MGQPNNRASFVKHQLWGKSIFCNLVRSHHLKGYDSENMYPQGGLISDIWFFRGSNINILISDCVPSQLTPPPPHLSWLFIQFKPFIYISYISLGSILPLAMHPWHNMDENLAIESLWWFKIYIIVHKSKASILHNYVINIYKLSQMEKIFLVKYYDCFEFMSGWEF